MPFSIDRHLFPLDIAIVEYYFISPIGHIYIYIYYRIAPIFTCFLCFPPSSVHNRLIFFLNRPLFCLLLLLLLLSNINYVFVFFVVINWPRSITLACPFTSGQFVQKFGFGRAYTTTAKMIG